MAKFISRALLMVLIIMMPLLAVATHAQDDDDEMEQQVEEALTFAPTEEQEAAVDDILRDEEAMLAGEGYFYDPGNRRDPFKSLLAAREKVELRGPRPEGIPGLLIDDIDLTGIFLTSDGPVAQVASADREKSYLLRVGDQLYDGDVISITGGEAVFKQIVDDPTALKPFREVVKKLNP
ncbi:MAG: hypothetical protein P8Y44_02405 [Acidobacteriota bacterium]